MPKSEIFIVCCGRPIRSLHYVPLTWSSHAGLSEIKVTRVFCNFSITDGKLLLIIWIPANNLPE